MVEYEDEDEYVRAARKKFADQIEKSNQKLRHILTERGVPESEIQRLINQGEQEFIEATRQFYDENRGEFWKNA